MFVPQVMFRDVTKITPEYLQENGILALVLDVDNTLTAHDSQEVKEDIELWLNKMQENGIKLMLGSNNTKKRVGPFAERLGLPFASFCCKPSPKWLWEAQKRWGLPKKSIALVGDQLFTDLLGGTLYGARVLVVKPLYEDIKPTVRFKRHLEKPFLLRYYKNGGKLL